MKLSNGFIYLCGNHLFILTGQEYLSFIINDSDTVEQIIEELYLNKATINFVSVIKELDNKTPKINSLKKRCQWLIATKDFSSQIPIGYKITLKKIKIKKEPWLELNIYLNKERIIYDKFSYDDYFLQIIKHTNFLKFNEKTTLRINKYMAVLLIDVLLVNLEGTYVSNFRGFNTKKQFIL